MKPPSPKETNARADLYAEYLRVWTLHLLERTHPDMSPALILATAEAVVVTARDAMHHAFVDCPPHLVTSATGRVRAQYDAWRARRGAALPRPETLH